MKKKMWISMVAILMTTLLFSNVSGQARLKASGISFRGSYMNVNSEGSIVSVSHRHSDVEVMNGHAGGWLTFYSRMNERLTLELGLGALGQVEVHSDSYYDDDVDVSGVFPVVLGVRYDLLDPYSTGALRPYISGSAGPYWVSRVKVRDHFAGYDDDVSIKAELKPGLNVGGGLFFHMSSWFALNMDFKYHLVNFDPDNDFSGLEFGFGLAFFWGTYKE